MKWDIRTEWLGLSEYTTTWSLQKQRASEIGRSQQIYVLGCEHPQIITLGTRLKNSDIILDPEIPAIKTDRGGLATLHTPGQLIIYPIFSLREWHFGVKEWVDFLLKVTTLSFRKCNIIIIFQENGLFTEVGKIASVGIAINKGISRHGLSLNITNDLSLFAKISPCGVQNQAMDKASHYLQITPEKFFMIWCETFVLELKNRQKQSINQLGIT